jgi:regulator of sirC expression with transglutaminase-like and TPR domain
VPPQEPRQILSRFSEITSGDDNDMNLAEAALLIASDQYPGLEITKYLGKIDAIAARVSALKPSNENVRDALAAINSVLFDEFQFAGNLKDYYDPRNSYLNEVIDRRLGIPITLSVIYIEVGSRIGLKLKGVPMPFHFLVKHSGAAGEIFIDPFRDGRLMDAADCAERLSQLSDGKVSMVPEYLLEAKNKEILVRMLRNIVNCYRRCSDYGRALGSIDKILTINPRSAPEIRDRGLVLAAMGRMKGALECLERYLATAPDAADTGSIKDQIINLRQSQARLN